MTIGEKPLVEISGWFWKQAWGASKITGLRRPFVFAQRDLLALMS